MYTKQIEFAKRIIRSVHRRCYGILIKLSLWRRGLATAYQIPTFTTREEMEALFELANSSPAGARVLEVGSYLGASTCFLAAGLHGEKASIVCIDTWQNETMPDGIHDTLEAFEKNVKAARHQITFIRKASSNVSEQELDGQFDLIFLDGDHSYKQVRADFELASGVLAPGGVLAFHDSLYFEGVSRVVGEALASAKWQIGGNVNNLFWMRRANFEHKS
jgi:predicted O-methyltransferase YrrM